MSDIIIGRNPCLEALRSGRRIRSVVLLSPTGRKAAGSKSRSDEAGGVAKEIMDIVKDRGVEIEYADRSTMDRMAGNANHQGVIAKAESYSYSSVEEIVAFAKKRGEYPFIILLDGIEDPHNLGAIIRTAECAGAHGVVIPKNRSAAVNETVLKTSAGAAEYMRCARVTNLVRTIDELKELGVWAFACDMGDGEIWDTDLGGPIAIVIGSEGRGVSRLARERCDGVISIPMTGNVGSLNASNAAAIAMYEVVRQRRNR